MNDTELEKMAEEYAPVYRENPCEMEDFRINTHRESMRNAFKAGYKKAREWVSVKERLPEEYCMCLVSIINARDSIASFNGEVFSLYRDEAGLEGDITHWMPLPDKPEGVE